MFIIISINIKSKMLMFVALIYCLIGVILSEDFYQKITKDEKINIFQTSADNISEYEIVAIYWPKLQRRNQFGKIALTAFGQDIQLQLNPVNGVLAGYNTPVYMARKDQDEIRFDKYSTLMKGIYTQMFEDIKRGATLLVSQEGNKKKIVGTITSMNLAIKPLPRHLISKIIKQRRLNDNITYHDDDDDDYHYHIIRKIPSLSINTDLKMLKLKTSEGLTIPDILYPEILVVVDHEYYKKLGENIWEAIAYLLSFWNGVDIKYRTLNNPEWRLNIAGIVIAEEPVLKYMEDKNKDDNNIDRFKALAQSGSFWYKQNNSISIDSYDLIVTMTTKILCRETNDQSTCHGAALGIAYTGQVCNILMSSENMLKVAIIHDEGSFSGINTAAHELGHLFGAYHDGGESLCSNRDGYIMTAIQKITDKSHYWSNCSINDFKKFIDTNPFCLYNKPNLDNKNSPAILPGKYLDANEQCMRAKYGKVCNIDSSTCQQLKCKNLNNGYCEFIQVPPVDGTECGNNKFCFRGQCIES